MSKPHYPVVILGAGVTGLTLAHLLKKNGTPFLVLEKSDRHGGVVHTRQKNGFVYESGPNSGVVAHPEVVSLFDDLGDTIQIEKGNDLVNTRYILKKGQWHALPSGPLSAISTPLFTLKDKFRILGEPFRTKGSNPDESLADLVCRRMGKSFLDYAIDPFILGVYAGDPSRLVPRYALPKLYQLEQKYGSFIKGTIKKRKEPKSELEKRTDRAVFSFNGGLSQLTNALLKSAGEENFRFHAKDLVVQPHSGGFSISYSQQGETIQLTADKVITTFGSVGLQDSLPFIHEAEMAQLSNLKYARVVEIALGFDKWEGRALDGFGGLIPQKEQRDLLGILFMSSLFIGRAPQSGALLSIFMGGVRNESICDLDDSEIMKVLEKEFKQLMDLKNFNPAMVDIMRYAHAIPQYEVSTGERLAAIDRVQKLYPGLIIAGNLRDGIGMADRIRQATNIANQICQEYA
jgi:oxygen-dependent protoporphyrinogen oxidase